MKTEKRVNLIVGGFILLIFSLSIYVIYYEYYGTKIEQYISIGNRLHTEFTYKGKQIYFTSDRIDFDLDMDSIKCVRYSECVEVLAKLKKLDKLRCK